jgi:hypothetical protein
MSASNQSRAIYLLPGMKVKIKALRVFVEHNDAYPIDRDRTVELLRGFAVEDDNIGAIEETEIEEPAVYYTHKKYGANRIFFFALTGEVGTIDVISVPIHDHASVVTGGPAYGTYFTDDETLEGGM